MKNALLLLSLLVSGLTELSAQNVQVTVPNAPAVNVDRPFPGGIGRYQQWFSAASLQAMLAEPMRLIQVDFFAGTSLTSQAAQIDCEFLMGYGNFGGLTGTFNNNMVPGTVVTVKSRGMVQLNAGGSGAVVMTVPFTTQFTWDRFRPVVLEVRIYGNSLGNQPFNYNFRGTTGSQNITSRVYAGGSALAPSGSVQNGFGMITRFTARPGVVLDVGTGCAGEGGFVPVASVSGLAWPGITWTHTLSNAASGRTCVWGFGLDNTNVGGIPLPADLTELLGYGPSGCLLRTSADVQVFATTSGGGAGSGMCIIPVPLPAVTSYVGSSVFTQWAVLDPLAPNGVLSTTAMTWTIVAVVGG